MSGITGAVAIGRNEGERLARCLASLLPLAPRIVYVDSGSTDGSLELARAIGAEVVQLDTREGFTAARARNAGFRRLLQLYPELEWVQFLDGDCQLVDGWLQCATDALAADPTLAVVCGRRRERYPERSVYNLLCDMEWNTPAGEAKTCGGDALMRVAAIAQVGGYNDRVIAGEEPEMCVRLRQNGWRIQRLDHEMTLHDADMTRLAQWARRMQRSGHAYAEAIALHGGPPERHGLRPSRSIWFWALGWPLLAVALTWALGPLGLLSLAAYPLLVFRIAAARRRQFHDPWRNCLLYGLSCVAGKWPQLLGQLRYLQTRLRGRQAKIIEYKGQTSRSV
jgi:GT2 family glycosyltransferase